MVNVIKYNNSSPANYTQYFYDAAGNKLRMYTGLLKPLDIYELDNVVATGDPDYSVTKYEYDQL